MQTTVIFDNTAIQSSFYENTSGTLAVKVVNSEFMQTIPLIRTLPTNEFSGNTSITSSQRQICGHLSCQQTAEGGRGRPSLLTQIITIDLANIRFLHR